MDQFAENAFGEWEKLARRIIEQSGVKLDHPTRLDQDLANVAQVILLDREQKDQRITDLERERDALAAVLEELHKQLLNEEDVLDGPDPDSPVRPNWAMQANILLGQILTRREAHPDEILAAHDAEIRKPLAAALETLRRFPTERRVTCHNTFNGGYRTADELAAFHHGMDTVFNVLEGEINGRPRQDY